MVVLRFTRTGGTVPSFVIFCTLHLSNDRYVLLDKQLIDFANTAINRPDMKGEHDIFNRVMPRDNIAVITFFEERVTGARLIVVNVHIYWDPAFTDVKLVQVAILMEQITKLADKYAKWPPCTDKSLFRYGDGDSNGDEPQEPLLEPGPSLEYATGPQIPLLMCGDFNSTPDSGVYNLLVQGSLSNSHTDLANRKYGTFTRDGMTHSFSLKSSYGSISELPFTNFTPHFSGVIDYIWYSTNALHVTGLLGEVDKEYLQRVPGFPNYHFPSDHLALLSEFVVEGEEGKEGCGGGFWLSKGARSTLALGVADDDDGNDDDGNLRLQREKGWNSGFHISHRCPPPSLEKKQVRVEGAKKELVHVFLRLWLTICPHLKREWCKFPCLGVGRVDRCVAIRHRVTGWQKGGVIMEISLRFSCHRPSFFAFCCRYAFASCPPRLAPQGAGFSRARLPSMARRSTLLCGCESPNLHPSFSEYSYFGFSATVSVSPAR